MTLLSIFGICTHQRITFPLTTKRSRRPYVACLDCGREFAYSWTEMRIGPEIRAEAESRRGVTVEVVA